MLLDPFAFTVRLSHSKNLDELADALSRPSTKPLQPRKIADPVRHKGETSRREPGRARTAELVDA